MGLLAVGVPSAKATTGPLVYGINPFDNSATNSPGNTYSEKGLRPFDAATGKNAPGFVITNAGGPVNGTVMSGNGLAHDPANGFDYAILKISGHTTRVLAKIDLSNGQATTIADTGHLFASITFATDGTLYGVTGQSTNNETCQGCLYTIDPATGTPTFLTTVTHANDGQAIAYNPVDNKIYHTNGTPTSAVFEKIDRTSPFAVTNVGYTGTKPAEVFGIGFDAGTGNFIMTDIDGQVWSVTPAGVTALLSTTNADLRGLIVSSSPVPANVDPTAVDDAASTIRGGTLAINVTFNDTDPEDDLINVASFTQPANGTVTKTRNTLTYVPNAGYCNDGTPTDDFTYTLTGGSTATVSVTVSCAQRSTIFGLDRASNAPGLRPFDLVTGDPLHGSAITIVAGPFSGTVQGATSLAYDPKIHQTFAVLKVMGHTGRVLARINLETAEATTIRDTQQNISSITFTSAGTLYAVSGNQSAAGICQACLYRVNPSTGAMTFIKHVNNATDGQIIAFDPNDGKLYHASGPNGDIFEKLDPAHNFRATSIGFFANTPFEPYGMAFDTATGNFVMTDASSNVWSVTPAGLTALLTTTTDQERGIVLVTNAVSLGYNAKQHLFKGRVTSPWPPCFVGRTVSIFRGATDVGDVVTSASGVFTLKLRARGTYIARLANDLLPGVADCPVGQSRTVKVS